MKARREEIIVIKTRQLNTRIKGMNKGKKNKKRRKARDEKDEAKEIMMIMIRKAIM